MADYTIALTAKQDYYLAALVQQRNRTKPPGTPDTTAVEVLHEAALVPVRRFMREQDEREQSTVADLWTNATPAQRQAARTALGG